MPTSTVEQYIKKIYQATEANESPLVSMKQVAEAMEVTPGTATSMVKHLHDVGMLHYQPRRGVFLTEKGRILALKMIRRHRLIETFLEQTLAYDWSEVHNDAETLEHAVSELFVQRLDRHLGFPHADPHGDPIPTAEGDYVEGDAFPLERSKAGSTVCVMRLRDDDPEFLDLMKSRDLVPGSRIVVEEINPVAGTISVRNPGTGTTFVMSTPLGRQILVRSE